MMMMIMQPPHWPPPENRSLYSQSLQLDLPLNIPLCRNVKNQISQFSDQLLDDDNDAHDVMLMIIMTIIIMMTMMMIDDGGDNALNNSK